MILHLKYYFCQMDKKRIKFLSLVTLSLAFFAGILSFKNYTTITEERINKLTTEMDLHTLSNYTLLPIKHSEINLKVNFEQKKLSGFVTHEIAKKRSVSELILDTKYLKIDSVQDQNNKSLSFSMGDFDDLFGQPLKIQLLEQTDRVTVFYETTEKAEALDWLMPNQTAGKDFPFMYTQGQSIFTRSWIPIQDTPGIRITYSANITVPENMMAVMSAANPQEMVAGNTYHFEMEQPISPYLIALAVGNLKFQAIDHRTGVYAEPSMLNECASELIDMGKMVDSAEKLYGAYDWDRYDVIVLPPSFPFGGMENPRLTFATPTIIAGDRSLVSLIAHELAHSWSGNLVTNATWNDFWLNEGFTVYFERRIMESLYGADYADMLALLGYQDLMDEISSIEPSMQSLKLKMKGRHPDDAMSDIAYEKGYFFLRMIEENVGRESMDKFLKQYFQDHKFQTIVTEDFLNYLDNNLLKGTGNDLVVEEWVYQPGLPKNCPNVVSSRFEIAEKTAKSFVEKGALGIKPITANWTTHEWLHFIKHLPNDINVEHMKDLDNVFGFSNSGNSEILALWFLQSIKVDYQPAFASLEKFLIKIGRRKFLQPLYEELAKNENHKEWAKNVYKKARNNYHYVSYNTVDKILN